MEQPSYRFFLRLCVALMLVALHGRQQPGFAQSPPRNAAARSTTDAAPSPADGRALPNLTGEDLKPSQRESFRRLVQKFPSPCGKPHSLLTSLKTDPQCRLSVVAVRWLTKLFTDDLLEEEVEERYLRRFGAGKCVPIDVSGAQVRGDNNAQVALIEFSDFECEYCRAVEPLIKQILAEFKNVKLVFMNYPQPMHTNAATAAAAALAAGKQDKFWQYHDKLFDSSERLPLTKLLLYARKLNLDLHRFQGDLEALRSRVAHERGIGEKLALVGTPSFFVGCQKIEGSLSIETIRSYVEAEIAR